MNRSAAIRKPQAKQQAELDRVTQQAKRMGCESSGFFSLFNGRSAQCGPVNNQIQQMRANLDQITTSLERLRSGGIGGADRENQRRSVLTALAQNNCGPQYAAAARGPGNFIDNLFGNNQTLPPPSADLGAPSGTFRTVCVRTCDGGYFPVSFATYQARFQDDEKTCKALCPATEATLFTYRNPGEDINQAVSISGQPYSSLPNAFKFRTEFNPSCACKAAGQTWSEALKSVDDRAGVEQGDIIVTEESAQADAAARAAEGRAATAHRQERRSACRHRRRAGCNSRPGRYDGYRRRQGQGPHRRPDLHPAEAISALSLTASSPSNPHPEEPAKRASRRMKARLAQQRATWFETALTRLLTMRTYAVNYPSNASAEARPARATSFSSGAGNALPLSRKRLVMG